MYFCANKRQTSFLFAIIKSQLNHIMKKISLLLAGFVIMAVTSCSTMQQAASSNTAASMTGQQAAIATNSLYKTYSSTGKLDLSNSNNVANILTVITAYNQLKSNKNDDSYRKAFNSGAISAGTGLITTANANTFANALLNSTGLSGVNASNIQNKVQTASTIITLLKALK